MSEPHVFSIKRARNGGKEGPKSQYQHTNKKRKTQHSSGRPHSHDNVPEQHNYGVLRPHTRQIPRATITSKWSTLSPVALQHARETLKAAKRSVVMSHWDERRRAEADTAINIAVKKVEKKMPRMPFPPKTKETCFDFDKLAENTRLLESQLTSAIHAVSLLKAEIGKEHQALADDRRIFAELQTNAKAELKDLSKQASKANPILGPIDVDECEDSAENINLREARACSRVDYEEMDEDIEALWHEFGSHLDSMTANWAQIDGLDESISRTQLALDCIGNQKTRSQETG
ncbi:MAG: hypothetical protein M1820_008837 [Bogoriella megaspora]|nr:MAG: hypothetical protein M1820_008837 [Bogoriella megaspora]